jgi:chorismate dehydratase
MWTARSGIELGQLDAALCGAREAGVAHFREIAEREAPALGLTEPQCLSYLRDNLYFYLGPRELRGLELFYRHAERLGLAPSGVDLGFDHCPTVG